MRTTQKSEAEKKIISYLLYYDPEEVQVFIDSFLPSVDASEFNIGYEFKIVIDIFKDILANDPKSLNNGKEFVVEDLINKIKEEVVLAVSSQKKQKDIFNFIDQAYKKQKNYDSNSEYTDMFLLGKDCVDYYFWQCFLDKVDKINNSSKDYKEKLKIKLPDIHEGSVNVKKLDEVEVNSYFADSEYVTGVKDLDSVINLQPTNVMYVAARPSVGKSMFVVNMAMKNALEGKRTLYISLEMTPKQTKGRIFTWLNQEEITDDSQIEEISKSEQYQKINDYFYILEAESLNGDIILSDIESFLEEYPESIIVLDSINLVRYTGEGEWESLRHISRDFKKAAIKYKSIMVACVQASRDSEISGLTLASLFGSSTLEQDADIVIGLEPKSKTPNKISELDALVLKNRDGIRDITFPVSLDKSCMRFYDSTGIN